MLAQTVEKDNSQHFRTETDETDQTASPIATTTHESALHQ